jgi:predicted nucleic acid-binding protein
VAQRLRSLLVDTDVFIDYLNGIRHMREILDAPHHRVYYAAVTRKELLGKSGLSDTERQRIKNLLLTHRMIPIDDAIAECFSRLLAKYADRGLRKGDALVAATAWCRRLPIVTRNSRHYRFISEIKVLDPAGL